MEQAGKHRLWSRHKSRTFLWPDSVGRALAFRRIVVEIVYEDASQPSIHFLYEVSYLIIWLLFSLPLLFSQLLFFSFSWARKKITGSTSIILSNYIHSTGVYIIYTPYIGETNLSSTPYTYSVRSIRKTIMHNAYIKNNNPCTCIGFAAKLGKARPTGWTTRHVKSTDQAPADWFWTGGGSAALAPVLRVTPAPGVPSCDYTRLSTSAPSGGPRSMEKEWWCLVLPQYVWGSKADSLEHQSINPCHVYASYCLFSVIIRSTMYEWVLLPRKTRHTPRLTPIHTHTHTHTFIRSAHTTGCCTSYSYTSFSRARTGNFLVTSSHYFANSHNSFSSCCAAHGDEDQHVATPWPTYRGVAVRQKSWHHIGRFMSASVRSTWLTSTDTLYGVQSTECFVHNKANQQGRVFSLSAVVDHGYHHAHTCMHTYIHMIYDSLFVYIYTKVKKTKHSFLAVRNDLSLSFPWHTSGGYESEAWPGSEIRGSTAPQPVIRRFLEVNSEGHVRTQLQKVCQNVCIPEYTFVDEKVVGICITANHTVCRIIWIHGTF